MTELSRGQYLDTYLCEADLPGMQLDADLRFLAPNDGDADFAANDGQALGRMMWTVNAADAVIQQIIDIRFAFPDSTRAVNYHRTRLAANAERAPAIRGAPPVASYCATFGGIRIHAGLPTPVAVTRYYYLFVVDRIVAKVFAAQSQAVPPGTLMIEHLTPIAQAAERRIGQALVGRAPSGLPYGPLVAALLQLTDGLVQRNEFEEAKKNYQWAIHQHEDWYRQLLSGDPSVSENARSQELPDGIEITEFATAPFLGLFRILAAEGELEEALYAGKTAVSLYGKLAPASLRAAACLEEVGTFADAVGDSEYAKWCSDLACDIRAYTRKHPE